MPLGPMLVCVLCWEPEVVVRPFEVELEVKDIEEDTLPVTEKLGMVVMVMIG